MTGVHAAVASPSHAEEPLDFERVFRAHAAFAWRCLRRLGVAEKDVDDVCQEVFLVLHRKLREIDPPSSVRAYLYGICVRKASDHRRLARHHRERATDELDLRLVADAAPDSGPMDPVEKKQGLATLDKALAALDEDKRAVFVLFEIEELSMQEVASAVDCPLQTAYARLYAGRKQIEAAFRRHGLAGRTA